MKKKHLIFTLLISIILISGSGCSKFFKLIGPKDYRVDLNNDGKKELIKIKRFTAEVLGPDKKKLGSFKIFDYSDKIQFVDLNKNGQKQIVLWTQGEEGFVRTFKIYRLRANRLEEIFNIDTNSDILTNFDLLSPTLAAGSNLWIWDGEQFVRR